MRGIGTRKTQITALWVVISFMVAQLAFGLIPQVFEPWNAQALDQLFLLRSRFDRTRPAYDDTIVHVDINNTAIQQLNNFYLNRTHYAQVVRNLAAMGTSRQVYDFIFAARSNDRDDRALIEAVKEAGNVYFGLAFALTDEARVPPKQLKSEAVLRYLESTKWHIEGSTESLYKGAYPLITFPELSEASRGLGSLSIRPDRDGVFRRAPLLVRYNGAVYPSLPFRVICDYLGVSAERIRIEPGRSIVLEGARPPGGIGHDLVIPVDAQGNMVINFVGPWERMKHYNFAEIYHAFEDREELELWREELQGKIVLISDVSTGSSDIGPVPTDTNFPLSGLHAGVMHTILTGDFLRELSGSEMLAIEIFWAVAVLLLALRFSSFLFSIAVLMLVVLYIASVILGFLFGHVLMNLMRSVFFMAFAMGSVTVYRYFHEEKEKLALRKTFEAYFPPSVVRKIMANPDMIASKGQKKELTILFSDIKSFTTYAASMAPDKIRKALNEYFEAMVEIVFRYQGTVDKYIGDGLMVFFGDPEPQPDHALRCVRAAIDMQHKVREIKDRWEKEGGMPIRIRIGISTGEVVVGNMGSARRLSYTVLGSAVNLAQRLESNAPVEGILISQRTYECVKNHVTTRSLGQIYVKGIETPVSVYEVLVSGASSAEVETPSPVAVLQKT